MQDSRKCSPVGRSCIDRLSKEKLNCSVACEGIYVDIQWEEESLKLGEGISQGKGESTGKQKKGDILNGKNLAKMIKEYADYKGQYVKHFRYNAQAESTKFGNI